MRWTVHVVRTERREVYPEFSWEYLREREHLEELDLDGIIILKCIFKNWDGNMKRIDLAGEWD
jgi:hypothetical protein